MRLVSSTVLVSLTSLSIAACGKKPEPASTPAPTTPPAADVAPTQAADAAPTTSPDAAPAPADTVPAPAPDAAPAPADAAPAADGGAAAADTGEEAIPPEAWTLSPPLAVPAFAATTGACIPGLLGDMGQSFFYERLDGRVLERCRPKAEAPDTYECWRLDLDKGEVTSASPPKELLARMTPPEGAPKPELFEGLEVSAEGAATLLVDGKKQPLDLGGVPVGIAKRQGELFFVMPSPFGDPPEGDKNAIVVFDKAGARVAKIALADFESSCPLVSWAGEVLFVEAGVCAGPGAVGFLVDPRTGKRLSLLGGATNSASAYGVEPFDLGDGTVAFREQYGHAIFVHDGKTGAIVKRLNLSAALRKSEDGYLMNDPEEGDMMALDGGFVVTLGGGSRDRVLIVDPKGGAITKAFELQACK